MSDLKILYDSIGIGYNATRKADPLITQKLLAFLSPQVGGAYLDIGCGTGNYTIALSETGLDFYGVEPSEKMLELARAKSETVNWLPGTAEQIPAANEFFDGAIATLTVHHWTNLHSAMREISRVLKPGAMFVVFTSTPVQMQGYWLNHYFPLMMQHSIDQMPSFGQLVEAVESAGMEISSNEEYFIPDNLKDCFLYAGKNRPELYLNEVVRRGISSFAALANAYEVEQGLLRLSDDIVNGQFTLISEKFNNDLGDYLFIIASKKRG